MIPVVYSFHDILKPSILSHITSTFHRYRSLMAGDLASKYPYIFFTVSGKMPLTHGSGNSLQFFIICHVTGFSSPEFILINFHIIVNDADSRLTIKHEEKLAIRFHEFHEPWERSHIYSTLVMLRHEALEPVLKIKE